MKDKEFEVEKIRSRYTRKEPGELEALKALDARVRRPVWIFGVVYGSLGALVMGAGMSLVLTDIGALLGMTQTLVPGIALGVVGMAMVLTTYPICGRILEKRRQKYADRILELSDRIMKG